MKKFLTPLALAASSVLFAQEATAPSLTLKDIIVKGGDIMYVLVLLSLVAVMLIVFYCLTLRSKVLAPAKFIRAAQDAAEAGDLEQLRELSKADSSVAAKIVAAACEAGDDGPDAMRNAMEEEGGRQIALLWSRIQYLMDVGTIAPMFGLLGTVWGMMVSFLALDTDLAMANKVSNLTSGVSQAMFTTFGGLIVGILAIAAYSIFRGHLNRVTGELEAACAGILRRFKKA